MNHDPMPEWVTPGVTHLTNHNESDHMRKVLFRRPENARKTVPAFVLSETEQTALLFVPCNFDIRPHCIVVADDHDGDGIFDVSENAMFGLQSRGMREIVSNLSAMGTEMR